VETFTISVDDLGNNGATLGMQWEKTYVGVPFGVPTREKAMKSIETVMGGPTGNDYFSAASYYFQEGLEMDKAKEWIDKAVAMNPDAFWMSRQQSLIYAKMGDKEGAIAAAKKSLAAAQKAGNADYVKMNQDSLKEWGAM
jgi:tetratricopeptide (TPR) repeat protein